MTRNELKEIHKRLEQMREKLIAELDQAAGEIEKEPQGINIFQNKEEAAEVRTNLDRSLALESHRRNNLVEIERALKKLDEGSYGTCDTCGKKIEVARLKALPLASQCIACKSAKKVLI